MRSLKVNSCASLLMAVVVVAVILGISKQAVSQTPPDPATGIWKLTKVVNVDACNACVQFKGCDAKRAACTDGCSSSYPPNDPRGAKCLDRCTWLQNRCVRDAEKTCQACQR
jgi:hypothetical protein